jgi:hypothetical protein
MTNGIIDTQHNNTLFECHHVEFCNAKCPISFIVMLNVIMMSVIMLSVVMLSVILLSAIMLSVVMLSVVMLNVVMLSVVAPCQPEGLSCNDLY